MPPNIYGQSTPLSLKTKDKLSDAGIVMQASQKERGRQDESLL
jgi:hypothetical protein